MTTYNPTIYKPENIDEGDSGLSNETPYIRRITIATFGLLGIPQHFLDVGCGMGQTVQIAREIGVEAQGVELYPRQGLLQHDLRKPLPRVFPEGADMVFCWEVAEHLPEESGDVLAKSLADNLADDGVLVFTAAIPGQGGLGHINCQIPWYWQDKFFRFGLQRAVNMTASLAFVWEYACGGAMYHLRQNLNVFRKL